MSTNVENLKREEIDEKYKWDVDSFYPNLQEWEEDYTKVEDLLEEFKNYEGKLKDSADTLYNALVEKDTIERMIRNIYSYASLRMDEDTRVSEFQALKDKAFRLINKASEVTSFFTPELLTFSVDEIEGFIAKNKDLELYEHYLSETLRIKDHVLSAREEAILAQVNEVSSAPSNIFSMLDNADLKFPTIKDEDGKDIEITQGNFIPLMESTDRRVRKDAFEAYYSVYYSFRNTFASCLDGELKGNKFYANMRGYDSTMEASLDRNNISTDVYDNLLASIHDNLEPMYKYMDIRKRALGVDELHMYDVYTPIVKDVDFKYNYEEGMELIMEGLAPLGEDYLNIVKEGFESRWIDAYETEGKRSGAYSGGSYDSKPFILLNYKNTLDSVFTMAHEMGHSVHSYLSAKNQPYVYSGYGIFVAEVASTVNEVLLINHMIEKAETKEEKIYLLNHYMDSFRTTVYRQSMFAEFEKTINEYIAAGGALTADYLNETYGKLNELYFGDTMIIDDEIKVEWARIPHFYYDYYVYQYATGYSAAVSIAQRILKGEEGVLEQYLDFLKSGSSDYPLNILANVGVDMRERKPIDQALEVFAGLVEEMDKLI